MVMVNVPWNNCRRLLSFCQNYDWIPRRQLGFRELRVLILFKTSRRKFIRRFCVKFCVVLFCFVPAWGYKRHSFCGKCLCSVVDVEFSVAFHSRLYLNSHNVDMYISNNFCNPTFDINAIIQDFLVESHLRWKKSAMVFLWINFSQVQLLPVSSFIFYLQKVIDMSSCYRQ